MGLMNTADIERVGEYARTTGSPVAQIVTGILVPGSYGDLRYAIDCYQNRPPFSPFYRAFTDRVKGELLRDSQLDMLLTPLRVTDEKFTREQTREFMAEDPNLTEVRFLSGLLAADIKEKKPKDNQPLNHAQVQAMAFAALERRYGSNIAKTAVSMPLGQLLGPNPDRVMRTIRRARMEYPEQLAIAEIFGTQVSHSDPVARVSRIESYAQRLNEIGVAVIEQSLAESEDELGGYQLGNIISKNPNRVDTSAVGTAIDYATSIKGGISLSGGGFEIYGVLPNGVVSCFDLKPTSPLPLGNFHSIEGLRREYASSIPSSALTHPDKLRKVGLLAYRSAFTFYAGMLARFITDDYLKDTYDEDRLLGYLRDMSGFAINPEDYIDKYTNLSLIGHCRYRDRKWDPIAAALRFQARSNPNWFHQAQTLSPESRSLIGAIELLKYEGSPDEGTPTVAFREQDGLKNLSKKEIKELESKTLATISGPVEQLRNIEALEYCPGYDPDMTFYRSSETTAENPVTVKFVLPVKGLMNLPFPLGGRLTKIDLVGYRAEPGVDGMSVQRDHYTVSRSKHGFIKIDTLTQYAAYSVSYDVVVPETKERPQKLPRELQNLDLTALSAIATELKTHDFKALSKALQELIKVSQDSAQPLSMEDLAQAIEEAGDYSYDERSVGRRGRDLEEVAQFVDRTSGRAKYQCDGASKLTAFIFNKYLSLTGLDRKYKAKSTSLYRVDSSKAKLTDQNTGVLEISQLGHARVHLIDRNGTIAIFDTTPKERTAKEDQAYVVDTARPTDPVEVVEIAAARRTRIQGLRNSLAEFFADSKIRGIFSTLSDEQVARLGLPIVEVPRIGFAVLKAAEQAQLGLVPNPDREALRREVTMNQEDLMRMLQDVGTSRDPRTITLEDGEIRDRLYRNLHEIDRVLQDITYTEPSDIQSIDRNVADS